MHEVKGDSKVTEDAVIKSNFFFRFLLFLHVAFEWELFKWWQKLGRICGGCRSLGVEVGGVIAAMIAATTVRRDNKSNYKDGSPSTDPVAVWN